MRTEPSRCTPPSVGSEGAGLAPLFASLRDQWTADGETPSVLAMLVKDALRRRFLAGERPEAAEYLAAFPLLREESDRALSLIYEEFCLREEAGETPDADAFCDRYDPWRDSLASQLNYHQVISRAAGARPVSRPRFPEPGERFQRFRLREILGKGSAAHVYLASNEDLGGRSSALKITQDRGVEPSIMGRLEHRFIMPVHSVVRDAETGLRGLDMPYYPGRPLDQILGRMANIPPERRRARTLFEAAAPEDLSHKVGGPGWAEFPRRGSYPDACAWLAWALAEALAHAHEAQILHLDVKPANVLIAASEGPQLLDFNLAHDPTAIDQAEEAQKGGTLPYMAPEHLEAFRAPGLWGKVGPRADLFALGLVLRELLIGARPEAPPADVPLDRAISDLLLTRADGWPPIRAVNPTVPHALEAIVARCVAPDPADRYETAVELAEDLRSYLGRQPLEHAQNPSTRERARYWLRRNVVRLTIAAAFLLMICAYQATRERGPEAANEHVFEASFALAKFERTSLSDPGRDDLLRSAEEDGQIALRLDPSNYRAFRVLGTVALHRNEFDDAEDQLTRAIRLARRLGDEVTHADYYLADTFLHRAQAMIRRWRSEKIRLTDHDFDRVDFDLERAREIWSLLPEKQRLEQTRILVNYALWKARLSLERLIALNGGDSDRARGLVDDIRTFLESADQNGMEPIQRAYAREIENALELYTPSGE